MVGVLDSSRRSYQMYDIQPPNAAAPPETSTHTKQNTTAKAIFITTPFFLSKASKLNENSALTETSI